MTLQRTPSIPGALTARLQRASSGGDAALTKAVQDKAKRQAVTKASDEDATVVRKAKKSKATAKAAENRDRDLERAEDSIPQDPTNQRFGNDMAFLDPLFQQEASLLGKSAASQASADPAAIEAQRAALDQLFGIAQGGGATATERARMQRARADQEGWLRGQRDADMQNLAERGMSGSGQELAALAMDRQAAAQRLSQADLETEAMLEQRAMDALRSGADLASGMRSSSFGEGYQRGEAQDQFDALNQATINSVGAANKDFLRDAWGDTIARRDAWDRDRMRLGLDTAGSLMSSDVGQNQFGFNYVGGQAQRDADRKTGAQGAYNDALINPGANGAAAASAARREGREADSGAMRSAGAAADETWKLVGNAASGGGF